MTAIERTAHGRLFGTADAATAQADIAQLRESVLGGRGRGAGMSEFLEHTRARAAVGGTSVSVLRERVARGAAAARRDADGLAMQVAEERAQLSADLRVLLPRLRPREVGSRTRARLRALLRRRRVRLVALTLAALLLLRSRRRWSTAGSPRANRPGPARHR